MKHGKMWEIPGEGYFELREDFSKLKKGNWGTSGSGSSTSSEGGKGLILGRHYWGAK